MEDKHSNRRFSIKTIVDFLNERKFLKGFRITYQVVWNLLLFFFIGLVSVVLFVGGAGAGFFASLVIDEPIRSTEEMRLDIYNYEEVTEFYFANDVYLGDLPSDLERREIDLKDVSKHLINAIIATEDEYFFEHEGIVPKAIFRATYQEFSNSSVQTGGSTLTQQLIKNQILTNEVSFDRKAKEILLAMRLENFFEKEEILEAYLNVVPFGRNANGRNIAGAQSAALGIFGVAAKELSIPQAAYIAGLPQSPFGYTPFLSQGGGVKESLEPSLNRMKTVLTRMRDKGYITERQYKKALKYDIRANLTERSPSIHEKYPHLTAEIIRRTEVILRDRLLEADGIKLTNIEDDDERKEKSNQYQLLASQEMRRNGYNIYTTIEKDIYDAHQEIAKDNSLFPQLRDSTGKPIEVGAVLLENKTGAIKSFVAGRYSTEDDLLNRATQGGRPNGSTMKSILAYAPAFELGLVQPGSILPDTELIYGNPPQTLTNWDDNYMGLLTVRESLQRSRNIPAVRSLGLVPTDYAQEKVREMGFNFNVVPSSALGPHNTTVEQNTVAYMALANGGNLIDSYMIEKIETKDGELIYEHKPKETKVYSEQTAYLVTDILRDVLNVPGTASRLPAMLKFSSDIAGKTGTSNETRDSWFVGYNPNFTMGVWIGFDYNESMGKVTSIGSYTQGIWANLANAAYEIDRDFLLGSNEKFKMPSGIVSLSFCGISGLLPSELCREAGLVKTDLFNSKFVPNKVDDSLERVDYVMLKGEPYRAFENTPNVFTQNGIALKEGYFSDESILEYLPENWGEIIPDRFPEDNGKTPAPISSAKLDGDRLNWSEHPEKNIIGYRVYQAPNGSNVFNVINTVRSDKELSMKVNNGPYAYKVTAIDVRGRESPPSVSIISGDWQKELPKPPKEIIPDKKTDEAPKDDEEENPGKPPKKEPKDDEKQNPGKPPKKEPKDDEDEVITEPIDD
ncbi:transglycosylase domain-containing protein [Bacillaceae bacterium IKA-2]|nr:transglycosylase domain-containing protein [Bacillaceae bacterium IKA-2]